MKPSRHRAVFRRFLWLFLLLFSAGALARGDEKQTASTRTDSLLTAARELMAAAQYCALITVDSTGQPHARMMDPFPPDTNMVVWLGTNPHSRKVREIRRHPQVTLYYPGPGGQGYVSLIGRARLVDEPTEKERRWKPGWEEFYPDRQTSYLLIAVTPLSLEIVSYPHGFLGDPVTWQPPVIYFHSSPQALPQK